MGYNDDGIILLRPWLGNLRFFAPPWSYFVKSSAGLRAKKLFGRSSNSCHIAGITGQSSECCAAAQHCHPTTGQSPVCQTRQIPGKSLQLCKFPNRPGRHRNCPCFSIWPVPTPGSTKEALMKKTERIRETLPAWPDRDYLRQKEVAGWRLVAVEWEREI